MPSPLPGLDAIISLLVLNMSDLLIAIVVRADEQLDLLSMIFRKPVAIFRANLGGEICRSFQLRTRSSAAIIIPAAVAP